MLFKSKKFLNKNSCKKIYKNLKIQIKNPGLNTWNLETLLMPDIAVNS
jgi:hypothetical protein